MVLSIRHKYKLCARYTIEVEKVATVNLSHSVFHRIGSGTLPTEKKNLENQDTKSLKAAEKLFQLMAGLKTVPREWVKITIFEHLCFLFSEWSHVKFSKLTNHGEMIL